MTWFVELLLLSAADPSHATWLATLSDRGPAAADAAQRVLRRHDDPRYEVVTAPSLVTDPDGAASFAVGREVPVPASSSAGEHGPVVTFAQVHDGVAATVRAAPTGVRVDLDLDRFDPATGEVARLRWTGAFAPGGDWVVSRPTADLVLVARAEAMSPDEPPPRASSSDPLLAGYDLDKARDRRRALRALLPAN